MNLNTSNGQSVGKWCTFPSRENQRCKYENWPVHSRIEHSTTQSNWLWFRSDNERNMEWKCQEPQ